MWEDFGPQRVLELANAQLGAIETRIVGTPVESRSAVIKELRPLFPADATHWCVKCERAVSVMGPSMIDVKYCMECGTASVIGGIEDYLNVFHPVEN